MHFARAARAWPPTFRMPAQGFLEAATQPQPAGEPAPTRASSMIVRMERAQRPHWALQPRQPKTAAVVCGAAVFTTLHISWSLSTLQEQTIIENPAPRRLSTAVYAATWVSA